MSVLIKGMEMPKNCGHCMICKAELSVDKHCVNYLCALTRCYADFGVRPDNCPLVELPPHGRLIDADELETDTEWSEYEDGFASYSRSAILYAPTIIEAEIDDG